MKNFFFLSMLWLVLSSYVKAQPVSDSIQIYQGWNLIGSIVTGPVDSTMYTIPPNAITSPIYKFNPGNSNQPAGYTPTDILEKMLGYWIKADHPAYLVMKPVGYILTTCGTVDYAGKTYNTIVIGDQCWLRQNLDVGTMIAGGSGGVSQTMNGVIEKFCYNDDTINCNIYGGLYQWHEAMAYGIPPGNQGICPNGWHIPSPAEFETLKSNVGGDGNKLKKVGVGSGGGAGTNASGFTALLAGWYRYDGPEFVGFYWRDLNGYFWSSELPTFMNLNSTHNGISISMGYSTNEAFSIRCIKN